MQQQSEERRERRGNLYFFRRRGGINLMEPLTFRKRLGQKLELRPLTAR